MLGIQLHPAPCLCKCGCTDEAGDRRYVCRFCGDLWLRNDGAHSPPVASVARKLRENDSA